MTKGLHISFLTYASALPGWAQVTLNQVIYRWTEQGSPGMPHLKGKSYVRTCRINTHTCAHMYTHMHTCTHTAHMNTHTQQSGWRGPHLARPLRCPRGGWQDCRGRQEAEGTSSPRYLRAQLQFNSTHQSVTLHQGLQLVHSVASQGNLESDRDSSAAWAQIYWSVRRLLGAPVMGIPTPETTEASAHNFPWLFTSKPS